jgi:ribonucleoside-diphosphate reductase alpha chain
MQEISIDVWRDKYAYKNESSLEETNERVVRAIYTNDHRKETEIPKALAALNNRLFCPGGRIMAGAGTAKRVTLQNCYVSRIIEDSLDSIMEGLKEAALTQQQGGGIGMDFSTLRPCGSPVRRTHSESTGPLPFMRMWDAMCETIKSSGSRRGAMMATMRIDHPDIETFIDSKKTAGALNNFNISVLVTDKFMTAVENGDLWELKFDNPHVSKVVNARHLWDKIIRSTYEYAEPGILFVDQANKMNNLWYCETLNCVNPCGEQWLPPYGACNLGAINLVNFITSPFTPHAKVDFHKLEEVIYTAVRFLDNVIDLSLYPLKEQKAQQLSKRRMGLGIMGLGNMLMALGLRYGSKGALAITETVMKTFRNAAYSASVELAVERGPFPLFDPIKYLQGGFIKSLPQWLQSGIKEKGIRNGVLLTVAPTGNTSILFDNVSSGLEPTFALKYTRRVLQGNGSYRTYPVTDYGYNKYRETHPNGPLPPYIVTANELTVDEHLNQQHAVASYIDASVSKTINVPEEIPFEDFEKIYTKAYELGLKGATSYRPSKVRGAILTPDNAACPSGICAA